MAEETIHVLLIEDNPGDARLISEILSEETSARFSLEHVRRLDEGLGRLEGGRVDVILLDLSLPDCLGVETFRRLNGRAARVPIIVLTSLDDRDIADEVLEGGGQDYLVKTYLNYAVLHRSIRHAIERKRAEGALMIEKQAAEAAARAKDQYLALLCRSMAASLEPVASKVDAMMEDRSIPPGIASNLAMIRQHLELEGRLIADLRRLDINEVAEAD